MIFIILVNCETRNLQVWEVNKVINNWRILVEVNYYKKV